LKTFVDDDEQEKSFVELNNQMETSENEKSFLAKLIRQSQNDFDDNSLKKRKSFDDLTKLNKRINEFNQQFLSTPAYLLPSIDHYCINSLKGMLLPIQNEEIHSIDQIENEHLSTMSVDSQEDS
jgi:hypothetical protein